MVQVTGREVESTNEVFIERVGKIYAFPRKIEPFQARSKIAPQDYALIQQGSCPDYCSNLAISIMQGVYGLNHADANIRALKQKLTVPTPSIFLSHYIHVNEASDNKAVLYNALGNLMDEEGLARYAYRLNRDCWVHLNAAFPEEQEKDTGFLGLDFVVMTGLDLEGNPVFSRYPLADCLEKNCWADLEYLNSQGLPTRKSKTESYVPGKVIYFGSPSKDSVARFYADSDWVYLNCSRNPGYSDSALGVFLCAEGAQKI